MSSSWAFKAFSWEIFEKYLLLGSKNPANNFFDAYVSKPDKWNEAIWKRTIIVTIRQCLRRAPTPGIGNGWQWWGRFPYLPTYFEPRSRWVSVPSDYQPPPYSHFIPPPTSPGYIFFEICSCALLYVLDKNPLLFHSNTAEYSYLCRKTK